MAPAVIMVDHPRPIQSEPSFKEKGIREFQPRRSSGAIGEIRAAVRPSPDRGVDADGERIR
jgi:hypothetical protein